MEQIVDQYTFLFSYILSTNNYLPSPLLDLKCQEFQTCPQNGTATLKLMKVMLNVLQEIHMNIRVCIPLILLYN